MAQQTPCYHLAPENSRLAMGTSVNRPCLFPDHANQSRVLCPYPIYKVQTLYSGNWAPFSQLGTFFTRFALVLSHFTRKPLLCIYPQFPGTFTDTSAFQSFFVRKSQGKKELMLLNISIRFNSWKLPSRSPTNMTLFGDELHDSCNCSTGFLDNPHWSPSGELKKAVCRAVAKKTYYLKFNERMLTLRSEHLCGSLNVNTRLHFFRLHFFPDYSGNCSSCFITAMVILLTCQQLMLGTHWLNTAPFVPVLRQCVRTRCEHGCRSYLPILVNQGPWNVYSSEGTSKARKDSGACSLNFDISVP